MGKLFDLIQVVLMVLATILIGVTTIGAYVDNWHIVGKVLATLLFVMCLILSNSLVQEYKKNYL